MGLAKMDKCFRILFLSIIGCMGKANANEKLLDIIRPLTSIESVCETTHQMQAIYSARDIAHNLLEIHPVYNIFEITKCRDEGQRCHGIEKGVTSKCKTGHGMQMAWAKGINSVEDFAFKNILLPNSCNCYLYRPVQLENQYERKELNQLL